MHEQELQAEVVQNIMNTKLFMTNTEVGCELKLCLEKKQNLKMYFYIPCPCNYVSPPLKTKTTISLAADTFRA